jgi:hypothetical protein
MNNLESQRLAMEHSMVQFMGYSFNIYGVVLLVLLVLFIFAMWRAQVAKRLDWLDMLTRDGTKVSTTKILQLVGGVVATWIVVQITLKGQLTWDMFAIYLAYVASIDGFSKLLLAKYGVSGSDDSSVPFKHNPADSEEKPSGSAKTE